MPTLAELFWHFVTRSSGVTIGLMLAAWLRMQSKVTEETYDTDCEFVTEHIANMESGPKIIRRPLSQWPIWADSINPAKTNPPEPEPPIRIERNFIGKKD